MDNKNKWYLKLEKSSMEVVSFQNLCQQQEGLSALDFLDVHRLISKKLRTSNVKTDL
jgi:hypothetical protein